MIYPLNDKFLLEPTEEFDFTDPKLSAIVLYNDMKESMIAHRGLGLSCNQVGLKHSMFVMGDAKRPDSIFACFNPKIVNFSKETNVLEEACLSLPGIVVKKERSSEIRVRYTDYFGHVVTKVFTGLTARIFQHEYDHIQGITILNGLSKLKFDMAIKKAKKGGFEANNYQRIG